MQRENDVPDVESVAGEAADAEAPLAVSDEPLPPAAADPTTLVRGFRHLAERIPGFRQLTPEESRSMVRASELGPEMIAAGIAVAEVWEEAPMWTHMTPEELRALDEKIRENDEAISAGKILIKGMEGANRVLKHRRGKAVLALYAGLGIAVRSHCGRGAHLRGYFENMQRAYMKNRKRKKEKEKEPPPSE